MDWSKVFEIALAIVAYGIAFEVTLWVLGYEIKKKLKYKFTCPICDFTMASSNREMTAQIQASHQHGVIEHDQGRWPY